MKTVHYIGWFVGTNEKELYSCNVPAMLKMRYIAEQIQSAGKPICIFSLARKNKEGLYGRKRGSENNIQILYAPGLTTKNKYIERINKLIKKISFVSYILFNVKSSDTIVLYHSTVYTHLLSVIRKYVNRHVILEVEEIYGYAAQGDDKKSLDMEFKSIPKMDEFILINDYLQEEFRLPKEKCIPCYGVVNIPHRNVDRYNDGKIHVVYAGTIEGRKQGAALAVETAAYLPDNYITHILGFGKKEHIESLEDKIGEINRKRGKELVIYHGFKSGNDLDEFLFKCHIGISTYVQRDVFANNSLPSKILTYMCHDLAVVRGSASAFKMMDISKFWTLYDNGSPKDVANAITKARVPEIGENAHYLSECNKKVVEFLKKYC